jgi:WD40 repeat protein
MNPFGRFELHAVNWRWLVLMLAGVNAVAVSADAQDAVRVDAYGETLPKHALARLGTVRFRHCAAIGGGQFSPDNSTVTTWDREGTVSVWRVPTGELINTRKFAGFKRIEFSPDGRVLAAGGYDGALALFDARTGALLHRLNGHDGAIWTLAISADSKWLASASDPLTLSDDPTPVRIWEIATGRLKKTIIPPGKSVGTVRFGPGANEIIICDGDKGRFSSATLRIWNLDSDPKPKVLFDVPFTMMPIELALGNKAIVTFTNESLSCVEVESGVTRAIFSFDKESRNISFRVSDDGKRLLVNASKGEVLIWDLESGRQLKAVATAPVFPWGECWSPDEKFLAVADTLALRLFDSATGRELSLKDEATVSSSHLAVSAGGRFVATAERVIQATNQGPKTSNSIVVWTRRDKGRFQRNLLVSHKERVSGLRFIGPELLLAVMESGRLETWDLAATRLVKAVQPVTERIQKVSLSADGRLVALQQDTQVDVVELESGKPVFQTPIDFRVFPTCLLPDGKSLLFVSDRQLMRRTLKDAAAQDVFRWQKWTSEIAASPDGKQAVLADPLSANDYEKSTLLILDLEKGDGTPRDVFAPPDFCGWKLPCRRVVRARRQA